MNSLVNSSTDNTFETKKEGLELNTVSTDIDLTLETSSGDADPVSDIRDDTDKSDITNQSSYCCTFNRSCRKAYRNLLGLSISFFFVFGVYLSEIGLQSSINEDAGLGLATLCIVYLFFFFSSFVSAAVVRILGTKLTMIMVYIGMTIYTLSNFYSSWYTLVPGSMVLGLVFGPLWTSHGVHITSIAHQYALDVGIKKEHVVFAFFGIYVSCLKMAYLPGNIISSVVLLNGRSSNVSIVEDPLSDVCNNTEAANLEQVYLYILFSVYVVLDITAIIVLVLVVDNISTNADIKLMSKVQVFHEYIKKPTINTLKLIPNWKMNVTTFMMMLEGYTISMVLGLFTKVYISDCIGVYWIGFCQTSFGFGSAVSAILNGYLAKIIPQYLLVCSVGILNIGTAVFLLIWQRTPSYHIVFIVLFLLGYSCGEWHAVPPGLVGTIFSHKDQEAAHSYCRMGLAVGFTFGFCISLFFDIRVLLWIDLVLVVAVVTSYLALIFVTQPKHKILPCCFRKKEDS